jgi:hypothetical protein
VVRVFVSAFDERGEIFDAEGGPHGELHFEGTGTGDWGLGIGECSIVNGQ